MFSLKLTIVAIGAGVLLALFSNLVSDEPAVLFAALFE